MIYLGIAIGLITGVGAYYLYAKYFSDVYSLGELLLSRAKGDVAMAQRYISKLV